MEKLIPIDIVAHADFSGRLKRSKRNPGFAAFGTAIDAVRRDNPERTLLLDAGDAFCTNFWGGEPCVKAVSLLKTDALTLGNHEFDRGQAFLSDCIQLADFPILCANIVERETGRLIPGTKPYVILEKAGVKIGVVGVTTEYTSRMVTATSFAPYEIRSCAKACQEYIPEVRNAGADIVVLLAHIPFYVEPDGSASGELIELLHKIPEVDVCVGGHIPGDYAGLVGSTIVLKGGFSGHSLCHARLFFDRDLGRIVDSTYEVLQTDWNAEPIPKYKQYEERITEPFRGFFEDVLATTDETWTIRLSAETKLGNLLADCVQSAAGTDVAYMNATSAAYGINPGPVTAEDVTAVMGFNDPILKANITGAQLYELFELVYVPERFGNNAGLLHAGLIVYADHTKPAFSKIQSITLLDGTPIDPDKTYTVATSEYMASGGNDTSKVANVLLWEPIHVRMYDAIFAHLRKQGELHVSPVKRMHEIGRPENDNSPF